MGPGWRRGPGPESVGSLGRRLSISLGKCDTVFQADIYAILVCAYEIQLYGRPEKYGIICFDSQAALKALQAARTTSPLVHQCQKALNEICTQHMVGLYWVPGHAGVRGHKIADKLTRDGSVQKFVGPEPSLGVSRQYIKRKIRHWLDNQHGARWQVLGSTQWQAREFTWGPSSSAKTRLLSFNRTQSRVMVGLLTGHNRRRRLQLIRLTNSPLCRRCGVEDETLANILCDCETLASLKHVYLVSFFLDPEYVKSLSLGAIWNYSKGTGLPWTGIRLTFRHHVS